MRVQGKLLFTKLNIAKYFKYLGFSHSHFMLQKVIPSQLQGAEGGGIEVNYEVTMGMFLL